MNNREKIDIYKEGEAKGLSQSQAATAAGERSARQIRRAVRVSDKTVADADAAKLDLSGLIEMAKARGENVEDTAIDRAMDATTGSGLYARLALLDRIAKRSAISVNYRVAALERQAIRVASPFGAMRCPLDLGLKSEICVDATSFLGSLRTTEAKFTATIKSNALHWKCGGASGRLAAVEAEVAAPSFPGKLVDVGRGFGKGLELGALGCGHSTFLRNAGLEAVQLLNRNGKAYALSTDSKMLSSCCLGPALPTKEIACLKPEAAALLVEVLEREEQQDSPEMQLGIDDKSVYCETSDVELQLFQLYNRQGYNLADKLAPFMGHKVTMPLMHEVVDAFLTRVQYYAEIKQAAEVEVTVEKGRTALRFTEDISATEEQYQVASAPKITVPPIRILARQMAKALAHATELVFDYADQNILVLRGPNEFVFGITGKVREE